MTDYNLTTIPVVDAQCRILGLITVDDVLEATLPGDWRRREAAVPPDATAAAPPPPVMSNAPADDPYFYIGASA